MSNARFQSLSGYYIYDVTNLKGPPATSKARPTTSEGAWAFFFPDNAAMSTIHIQISSIFRHSGD